MIARSPTPMHSMVFNDLAILCHFDVDKGVFPMFVASQHQCVISRADGSLPASAQSRVAAVSSRRVYSGHWWTSAGVPDPQDITGSFMISISFHVVPTF